MKRADGAMQAYEAGVAGDRRYVNILIGLRRRVKRLKNSMAHTPKPKAGDFVRWRRLEAEIAKMRQDGELLKPGGRKHWDLGADDAE